MRSIGAFIRLAETDESWSEVAAAEGGRSRRPLFVVRRVAPQILHLVFPSQEEMCRTLLRFQEHFESPKFRGRFFSLAQFRRWYESENGGLFSYYTDWSGFNFPSAILEPFRKGLFGTLSRAEKAVLAATSSEKGDFYVIATVGGEEGGPLDPLRHELGHACYHVDRVYRGRVDRILRTLDAAEYPMEKIRQMGYDRSVVWDELHAYLIDGYREFSARFSMERFFRADVLEKYKKAAIGLNRLLDQALRRGARRMASRRAPKKDP